MTRNAEYDAFGPWITQVTGPSLVPRLFRDHPLDFDRVELAFKIPRNIDRRNATPAMHLYDALLVLTDGTLTVLLRAGDGYHTRTTPLTAIWGVRDSSHLLDGRFTLHTVDGTIELPYNGAGQRSIDRLVERLQLLRRLEGAPALPDPPDLPTIDVEAVLDPVRDYALIGAYRILAGPDPEYLVVGAHPTMPLSWRPDAGRSGLASALHRTRFLQGAVYVQTPDDVVVIGRRAGLVAGDHTNLSHSRTVIFPDAVPRVQVLPHPDLTADVITINGRGQGLSLLVPRRWPSTDHVRWSLTAGAVR